MSKPSEATFKKPAPKKSEPDRPKSVRSLSNSLRNAGNASKNTGNTESSIPARYFCQSPEDSINVSIQNEKELNEKLDQIEKREADEFDLMEKLLAENSKLNLTAVNEMMQERVFEFQNEIFIKFRVFLFFSIFYIFCIFIYLLYFFIFFIF